jgi:hypothetical protein
VDWKQTGRVNNQSEESGTASKQDYEYGDGNHRLSCRSAQFGGGISAYAKRNDENVMLTRQLK